MKFFTNYLLKFTFIAIILTFVFRFFLTYGVTHQNVFLIIISSVIYGLCMFLNGSYFGKKERKHLPIFDVGFRFHLMIYLVHNICSELWFYLNFTSKFEQIGVVHLTAFYWGVFLAIHFCIYLYLKKKTIRGLRKEEIFE